ncbi:MAG TPA: ABC transporter substrate-binding protein, partial [Acidimicrobiales bacterium]|nr:ABC transporter substrate-binding protein [Acidimicrobiales bacterium]
MRHFRGALVALATVTCASGLLVTGPSEVVDASGSPITIALVTSLTGPAAPEFSTSPAAFKARIALQNAEGGVNGHKLVPLVIDDQTTQTTSAVQDAISKGVFGIVSDSSLFFSAAKYPQQQGIPVTGGDFDGPEWGEQPYTNMFSSDDGSLNPKYPVNLNVAHFMKEHGGTILGTYGYSVSPSSARAAVGTSEAFVHYGGKVGVLNTSVPFGGVDFTADALVAKQKGVNA